MCKISNQFLKYVRSFTLIDGVSSISAELKIAHPSDCVNYVIEQTPELLERVSVYANGLVIYVQQTANKAIFKSNFPFVDKDDGIWVMNE